MEEEEKEIGKIVRRELNKMNVAQRDFHHCMVMSQAEPDKAKQIQEL